MDLHLTAGGIIYFRFPPIVYPIKFRPDPRRAQSCISKWLNRYENSEQDEDIDVKSVMVSFITLIPIKLSHKSLRKFLHWTENFQCSYKYDVTRTGHHRTHYSTKPHTSERRRHTPPEIYIRFLPSINEIRGNRNSISQSEIDSAEDIIACWYSGMLCSLDLLYSLKLVLSDLVSQIIR